MTETVVHDGATAPVGPKLDGVRWLHTTGWYDGPLWGMALLPDGREVFAEIIEECDCYREADTDDGEDDMQLCGFYRRYQLTELSPEKAALQAEHHADFQRWVGTHWDRTDSGDRNWGGIRPRETHHLFYDKWLDRKLNLADGGTPVGWMER